MYDEVLERGIDIHEEIEAIMKKQEPPEPRPYAALKCGWCGGTMSEWEQGHALGNGKFAFRFTATENGDAAFVLLRYSADYPPIERKLPKIVSLQPGETYTTIITAS